MLETLLLFCSLIIGYFFFQSAGYLIHRSLHWQFAGRGHHAHKIHHETLYSITDFLKPSYQSPPWYNLPFFYYLPLSLLIISAMLYFLPLYLAIALTIELCFIGWLNDYLHMVSHISGHWLERYKWFHVLRRRHWQHHLDDSTNFGIFSWINDKLLLSFREPVGLLPYEEKRK